MSRTVSSAFQVAGRPPQLAEDESACAIFADLDAALFNINCHHRAEDLCVANSTILSLRARWNHNVFLLPAAAA